MRQLVLVAVGVVAAAALGGCHSQPTVSVTPATGLLDGQEVAVRGGGYAASAPVGVIQCPAGVDSIDDCDSDTAKSFSTDSRGHFSTTLFVKRQLRDGHGVVIDCAASAGRCVVASVYQQGFANLATTPLSFTSPLPGPLSVVPSRGLVDGQTVHVSGQQSGGSAKVMQCPSTIADYTQCDMRTLQYPSTGSDGHFAADVIVHAVIRSDAGTTTDCRVPGACMMIADLGHGWSIFFPTWAPLAFAR